MRLKYNPKLKELAKKLRNNSTLSEIILWQHLKGKKMLGYDFHRQKPIDEYVVDFFCHDLMLAIEIDGSSHGEMESLKHDDKRRKKLERIGIRFLRFSDSYVKKDIDGVLRAIGEWIKDNTPRPLPPRAGSGTPLDRGD